MISAIPNMNAAPAGFSRFPARMALRSLRVVRAERVEGHAPQALFRHRHTETEPLRMLPVVAKGVATPSRVPAARITVRV